MRLSLYYPILSSPRSLLSSLPKGGEGRLWRESTGRDMPPFDTHDTIRQAIGEVFFRRSRLFFREAAFSSGDEGCEWGAKQPTVGESGDKAENEFSSFIPLVVPRKGFSPHIPASRLFVHFHTTMPTSPPNPSSIHQVESIQSVGSVGSIVSIHSK